MKMVVVLLYAKIVLPPFKINLFKRKEFASLRVDYFNLEIFFSERDSYAGKKTRSHINCLPFKKYVNLPKLC